MSNDAKIEITRNNIDRYLYELAKEYKKDNKYAPGGEIIVVGGAAMMLNYNFRETTEDIDAIVRASSSIKESINKIEDKYNLHTGWLNSDFLHTPSYTPKLIQHSKYYKTFCGCLDVRTVSAEYLIAMKLKSSRLYKKDLSDIVGILKEHKELGRPISRDNINSAIIDFYGNWDGIKQEAIDTLNKAFSSNDLEDLYYELVDNESINRQALLNAQEKYSDVLNEDNVDSFINTFTEKTIIKENTQQKNKKYDEYER